MTEPDTAPPTWRWFACCENCGKAIVGESEEAIRGAIVLHKMEGCDD